MHTDESNMDKNNITEYVQRVAELESENKLLQHSSQLAQDAIAFTGHEWRNHLSLLNVACSTLIRATDGTLSPQQKSSVERIQQSANAMQRIADNYLGTGEGSHLQPPPNPCGSCSGRDQANRVQLRRPAERARADLPGKDQQTEPVDLGGPYAVDERLRQPDEQRNQVRRARRHDHPESTGAGQRGRIQRMEQWSGYSPRQSGSHLRALRTGLS